MRWCLGFFILLTMFLGADEEMQLIRQADAYFHAKEYTRAFELYASLLNENLASWQQARLRYNLGTILMWKGEAEKASRQFSEVPFSIKSTPYLARALQTNLAILNFRMARAGLSGGKADLEIYSQALRELRTAMEHVDRAEKAECRLQEVKGGKRCGWKSDLKELREAIKYWLAVVLDDYGNAKVVESPSKEGIPYLITGTNLAEAHLDFLESVPAENPLRDAYQKLFTRDMQAWGLFWQAQEEKIEELASARSAFDQGTRLMEEAKYGKSRLAFLDAEAKLTELMQQLLGDDPFTELLRKVLIDYQYALDQLPVQPATLYQLTVRQKQVNEIAEGSNAKMEFLGLSNVQLEMALESAKRGQEALSRLYLQEARQWMRRLLRGENPSPEEILEASLQDQEHALEFNYALERVENREEKLEALLKGAQSLTLQTAAPFLKAVLEKEIQEWPKRCQCTPWNRVIPLFAKGEEAALAAEALFKQNHESPQGMRKQEEAVDYWKQALRALRHPEEEKKEEEKPQQKPPPPQEEKEEKQPIEEVMRQLQKMHRDDRKADPGSRQIQKGIRPW
ncbi:hypothetical protein [Waddlia chondrophila]|uniref:Tetratricopeptide repeat protein n=1 Tax=Waddlia chondrophila (strain ATCC VR-1470 / WSU 86-1044) TaxID=716544 RepID=D6YU90_WADCW|nr:hypothetical protein [Waddlia chondrophila]ADI37701.1 hypothetical protein wcw_0327 [Waddlia chondrophila WSU 86-1044]